MSSDQPVLAGVALRYATALFELALEVDATRGGQGDEGLKAFAGEIGDAPSALDVVAGDLANLNGLIEKSEDLTRLVRSPVISRDDQKRALDAILEKAGAMRLIRNFVSLVAANRRLFALEDMIKAFQGLLAQHRGELSATVTSAVVLNDEHVAQLKETLKSSLGQDVQLETNVDDSLIGGLIVKVGSRMIDSSIRTKLSSLKIAMKEVG